MARLGQQRSTGTKRTGSVAKKSKSSGSSREGRAAVRYLVCVRNAGYPAALERRKIYATLTDAKADELGMVRVIDESGEDYLYPRNFFSEIRVSPTLAKALASAT